jgi:hypothetical protein
MMASPKGRHPADLPRSDVRYAQLSQARQKLIRLLQRLNFGTIHQLPIRNSDPVLAPPLRIVRRRKSGTPEPVHPGASLEDFALKGQWLAFFEDLDAIGDGQILRIEVAHGLPLMHEIEEAWMV